MLASLLMDVWRTLFPPRPRLIPVPVRVRVR